jgi:hypothetical protein
MSDPTALDTTELIHAHDVEFDAGVSRGAVEELARLLAPDLASHVRGARSRRRVNGSGNKCGAGSTKAGTG